MPLNTQDVHSSVIAPAPQRARDDSLPSVSIQGMTSSKCSLAGACTCAFAELQGQTAQNPAGAPGDCGAGEGVK